MIMSRTRAERRHNTRKKCKARKNSGMCSAAYTPSGEACNCSRCETEKKYIWNQRDHFIRLKKEDDAWWASQE